MKPARFHSIRARLLASYLGLACLTALSVSVIGYVLVRHAAEQREVERLRAYAQVVSAEVEAMLRAGAAEPAALQALAERVAADGDLRVQIYDAQDDLLAEANPPQRSISFEVNTGQGATETITAAPGASGTPAAIGFGSEKLPAIYLVSATPRSARSYRQSVGDPGNPLGSVALSQAPDWSGETLDQAVVAFLQAGLVAALIAALVGLWVSHRLTAPIQQLSASVESIAEGDFSQRAPVQSQDEVGVLAVRFNQMGDRLAQAFSEVETERDTLKRFVADASHELRTPVTALKTFNELLQAEAGEDPAARAEFLRESGVQIDKLAWTINNLLDLSRLDAGLAALSLETNDAGQLLAAVAGGFRLRAARAGIELKVTSPGEPLDLICDRPYVELALSNLVENALKFTSVGGQVEIGVQAQPGERLEFWVRDTGCGIPAEDIPHVFERFYRGKGGASLGSGLGLSIVKSVIAAHGGDLSLESRPGEGTLVRVAFSRQACKPS